MSIEEKETEQKIKEAARKIFQQKGFAATKTRDIAEASGINLALLNYYFRGKKKLYDLIMMETIQTFFSGVLEVLNNEETSLKEKIELFVAHYIDMLSANPNVASFILNEIKDSPEEFIAKVGLLGRVKQTKFFLQFMEGVQNGTIPPINPIHLMVNLAGLVVFPFLAAPMVTNAIGISEEMYFQVLQERKKLIPLWIESMLTVK